ncbi:MAG: class IV adenylate cyclase [Candidatus Saccharimonadales bacterium]
MQTEIEVKFLNVDHDEIRSKLKELGALLEYPMRLMRRSIMDYEDERLQKDNSYIRVRDEGDKITLTFKKFHAQSVDGAKELAAVVDDYDTTIKLLEAVGLTVCSQQESKREAWQLGECEVVLDEWPWLKPYIEIEGPSEMLLRETAKLLGFDWGDAAFGDVTVAYLAEYDVPAEKVAKNPRALFSDPAPEWLASARKA